MQELISIGDKVDMELLGNGEVVQDAEKRRILSCKVMDILDDRLLRITMPFYERRIVPLSVGDQYEMRIFSVKGIYGSKFTVINRLKEGNIFMADMELLKPLKKVQRREYFRHDCQLPGNYRMVSSEEDLINNLEGEEQVEWKKCVILDISGGGMRMISEFQEKVSEIIQVRFPLDNNGEQQFLTENGKLISSVPKQAKVNLYEQRIEFNGIEEQDRERIIRYIFDEERKKISKEKGLN